MAKPIFTVGVSNRVPNDALALIEKQMEKKFNDYHVLIYRHNKDGLRFDAYYEKDMNVVKFAELKEIINNQVNKK